MSGQAVAPHAGSRLSIFERSTMEISARNQLRGHVTAISKDAVMATVEVAVEAATITAAITTSSVERLGLKNGENVVVIIKATEVMIGK
jgi:molybdopterin-binding protein